MSKRKKLYHGSPHRLDEIRPATATGKGEASAREHAIYLANNPAEARLYALTRPRNNKRKGWAILDNKVHYVKGDPINKQGYVYEHEFDDYEAPPESDPGIGYRVYGAYKPTKRKRVRLRGIEDQFVEHPDKASYKAKVKEWLASREKTSSYREGGSFTHEGTEYDLDHALSLADKQPVTSTRVKDLAWVLRHGKADPERVRRADLSAPLLVSHTSDGRPTVVDGFHRLTKANNEGVTSMPTRFVDRKELRKTSAVKHTLVTGHSGAGKSTLARSFGLPIHALDDDPDIREQLNRQMAYARANQGRLPTGKRYARDMQRAEERAIERAMALKDPHVIEGSYLLNRDPEDFRAHNMHLVDTPEDVVLDRRVERQRVKDIARNRHWDDERAKGVRMRGQQLIDEYAPGVKRWRSADYVKKAALKSQEDIFRQLKRRIPSGAHHVSGGLPDARGLSDVDIYLPRKKFTGLESRFPKGTSITEQGDDYAIYSIPGFKREVNVYATNNPAKRESIDHRRTMMALANKYPQAERKAFAIKQRGKGSEPAWAEVLGLQGDPYEVMRDTDKVMRHASTMKLASKRFRHRATLLLQDDQGRIFAKKESPERVAQGVSRVNLPGGGVHEDELETRVPTKREIIRAARKEALEELGMRIRHPRLLGSHSGELEDWWKDQQEKKRGVRFDGAAEHFVLAKPSKKDMSMYNVEGDAFKGQYYDLKDLDPLVAQDAKRDSAFAQFNRKQLELMRGLQKKASKEVRIGRKVYRPKVQAFMYDGQGRILAAKAQASGSGLRAFDNYKFPGGGIEAGENVAEAARKELLEEAGYETGGDMFEFGTPTAVDWDKKFRRQARKKGRGRFAGQYEYYAAGPIGKRNTSLLGSEGDALGRMEFVPMSKLRRALTRTANDPKNEYGYFDKQKLVALNALQKELKQRGVKTASLKKLVYHKFIEPILDNNNPQIKQTARQLKALTDSGDLDLIREHVSRGGKMSRRRFLKYVAQEGLEAQKNKYGYLENIARSMDQQHKSYSLGEQAREVFGTALGHTPYGAIPGALLTNTGTMATMMAAERPFVELARGAERAATRGYRHVSLKDKVKRGLDRAANMAEDFAEQVEAYNKGDNVQQGLARAGLARARQGVESVLDENARKYGYSTAESVGDYVLQQLPLGQSLSAVNRAARAGNRNARNAALPPGVKPPKTRAELRRFRKQKDRNRLAALALAAKMRLGALKPRRANPNPAVMVKKARLDRLRRRSLQLPPEFGKITDRYYQTHGQDRLIAYGNSRYVNYVNPQKKRERRMEDRYRIKTAEKGVATKTDPAKWARAKAQARAKMGGKHSARAMQLATQIYKKSGGGYSGKKPSSGTNKLKKWGKQKWQWSGKDKPGPGGSGVYLPKRSSEQLKSTRSGRDKLRAAAAAKRAATASGRQFSSHGLHVGKKRSDVR